MQGKATTWTAQSKWDWPSSIFNLHCTQGQKQTLQNTNDKTNYRNSSKANDTRNHDTWGGKITSSRLKEVFLLLPKCTYTHQPNESTRVKDETMSRYNKPSHLLYHDSMPRQWSPKRNKSNQINLAPNKRQNKQHKFKKGSCFRFIPLLFLLFFSPLSLAARFFVSSTRLFFLNWNNQVAINNWHDFRFFKHELLLRLSFSIPNLCVIFYLGRKKISP